jgi:hypothetical protein
MEKYQKLSPADRKKLFLDVVSESFGEEARFSVSSGSSVYVIRVLEMVSSTWMDFVDLEERIHNELHPYTFSPWNRKAGTADENRWFINVAPGKMLIRKLGNSSRSW